MTSTSISRRDVIKTLTMGATAGSVLNIIPLQAAEHIHKIVKKEKAKFGGGYAPKFFSVHHYKTLQALCQAIIPPDEKVAGAIEAGTPEFIDLLTSENKDYQLRLGGGMMWLDAACRDRFGNVYLDCLEPDQKEMLDLIAYQKNAEKDPSLVHGIHFFSFLRSLTCDGFFTSKMGIEYLQYIGNTVAAEFPGCPALPEN